MNHWKSQESQEVDEEGQGDVSAPPRGYLKTTAQTGNITTQKHTHWYTHSQEYTHHFLSLVCEVELSLVRVQTILWPSGFDLWPKLLWLKVSVTSLSEVRDCNEASYWWLQTAEDGVLWPLGFVPLTCQLVCAADMLDLVVWTQRWPQVSKPWRCGCVFLGSSIFFSFLNQWKGLLFHKHQTSVGTQSQKVIANLWIF